MKYFHWKIGFCAPILEKILLKLKQYLITGYLVLAVLSKTRLEYFAWWRIFKQSIFAKVENVETNVLAALCLH